MRVCICISRKYGSGGQQVAEKVAQDLALPCYDRELIADAVRLSGVDTSLLDRTRPKEANHWLYEHMYTEQETPYAGKSPQEIFMEATEATVIELSGKSDCIFIGRNAARILEEKTDVRVISVFITALLEDRVAEIMRRDGADEIEARREIRRVDRVRSDYFEYYRPEIAENKDVAWGDPLVYDACFNGSLLSPELMASAIEKMYIKVREQGEG
jgi:cytidylate kinase